MGVKTTLLLTVGSLAIASTARAETTCMSIDEFNVYMSQNGLHTPAATLTFDVTGVDPNDYVATKGALVEFADLGCAAGPAGFTTKLYGPDDPPNLSHPPGTLKQEFNDACCAQADCPEGWADPNASAQIFVDGSEQCLVTAWIDPAEHGYTIDCDGTVYEGVGPNLYGVQIDAVSILVGTDGALWPMPNAISTTNEICFEPPTDDPDPGPDMQTMDVAAIEDVTASAAFPDAVYPEVADLSAGAGDSEFFVKFDLGAIPGTIVSAHLQLASMPDNSADGDGADVWFVADNDWSEATLTWNGRPAPSGAALDRVGPVALGQTYVLDVSAAVADPGVYSFALVPQAGDQNGIHFLSTEGSATQGPVLHIEYVIVDGGADGTGSAGGTSNGSGSAGVETSDAGTAADTGPAGGLPGLDGSRGGDSGCTCRGGGGDLGGLCGLGLLGLGLLGLRRRRHAR
jgi:MYXO-CTERM domain-containing protein